MGLADQLAAAKAGVVRGPRCTIALLLAELSEADAEALRSALDDLTYFGTTIAQVLEADGHSVGNDAVQRHRRGSCACRKTDPTTREAP